MTWVLHLCPPGHLLSRQTTGCGQVGAHLAGTASDPSVFGGRVSGDLFPLVGTAFSSVSHIHSLLCLHRCPPPPGVGPLLPGQPQNPGWASLLPLVPSLVSKRQPEWSEGMSPLHAPLPAVGMQRPLPPPKDMSTQNL